MSESILTSIKKNLGIVEEYTQFDQDIMMHTNTALNLVNQLGLGVDGFTIKDSSSTWEDFLGDDEAKASLVKSYVYLKVRLLFDPPTGTSAMTAFSNLASELEWRMTVKSDEISGSN